LSAGRGLPVAKSVSPLWKEKNRKKSRNNNNIRKGEQKH